MPRVQRKVPWWWIPLGAALGGLLVWGSITLLQPDHKSPDTKVSTSASASKTPAPDTSPASASPSASASAPASATDSASPTPSAPASSASTGPKVCDKDPVDKDPGAAAKLTSNGPSMSTSFDMNTCSVSTTTGNPFPTWLLGTSTDVVLKIRTWDPNGGIYLPAGKIFVSISTTDGIPVTGLSDTSTSGMFSLILSGGKISAQTCRFNMQGEAVSVTEEPGGWQVSTSSRVMTVTSSC